MSNPYFIEPIVPGLVQVHEHEFSYPMTRTQAEEHLAVVTASRENYARDDDYLRRVTFYEDVLAAINGTEVSR